MKFRKSTSKTQKRAKKSRANVIRKENRIVALPSKLPVNDDCLSTIFEFLDVNDLVNIAEADERLVLAATQAFSRRHRNKEIVCNSQNHDTSDRFHENNFASDFLRHFGPFISRLSLTLCGLPGENDKSIQKYCLKSLVNLKLRYCSVDDFESMTKPFSKVKQLEIFHSRLGQRLSKINLWFPALERLELRCVEVIEPKFMEVNFPHLKHLVFIDHPDNIGTFPDRMLRFNPLLKSLELHCEENHNLLKSISKHLVLLEELEFWPQNNFMDIWPLKYRCETIKKFTLDITDSAKHLLGVPFELVNLEELTIYGFNRFQDIILDFVNECKTLTKLKLIPSNDFENGLNFDNVQTIIQQLPELIELEFSPQGFTRFRPKYLFEGNHLQRVHLLFVHRPSFWRWDGRKIEDEYMIGQMKFVCPGLFYGVSFIRKEKLF